MSDKPCISCGASDFRGLWKEKSYRIAECPRCGLIFQSPQPLIAIDELYGGDYFSQNYVRLAESRIEYFRGKLKDLSAYKKSGKLLDIGSGTGFFLKAASEAGWEAHGVEPSPYASAWSKDHYGATVHTGDILNAQLADGSFDLITFWDVIAHLPDPSACLKKARELLKDDGVVAIKTPHWRRLSFNIAALLSRIVWNTAYLLHVPRQLYFFTEAGMRSLLANCGFEILKMEPAEEKFSFKAVHSNNAVRNLGIKAALKAIDAANSYPGMIVVAKKAPQTYGKIMNDCFRK